MSNELDAANHATLTRLVIEVAWRVDHGKADTIHELFVDNGEMGLTGTRLSGRQPVKEWGLEREHQL